LPPDENTAELLAFGDPDEDATRSWVAQGLTANDVERRRKHLLSFTRRPYSCSRGRKHRGVEHDSIMIIAKDSDEKY
jgi:hypothetical protein